MNSIANDAAVKAIDLQDDRDDLPVFIHSELDDLPLSSEGFRVYCHLVRRCGRSGQAWSSYQSIGDKCFGVDYPNSKTTRRNHAIKAMKEIEEMQLISVERRKTENKRENLTNIYRLNPKRKWKRERGSSGGELGSSGGEPKGTPPEGIPNNQSNNQRDKVFSGQKTDLVTEPIESGKKSDTSEDKHLDSLTTKSSPVNAFSQEVRSLELIGCAANFSKKEKSVALKYDDWGVLQLPRAAKYKLPSLLTIRTMQFLVAERCFGCQFGLEDDGTVWIYDSLQEEALTEDAAFGEDGVLPLKKLISVANSDCSHVTEAFDAEWYNDTLLQYFQLWRDWCDRVGKRATEITKSKSVALLIDKLIEFDEDFFDDFEMPDIA